MIFPKKLNRLLITWFGCGNSRFAPGTVGSLGALPLCIWISDSPLEVKLTFAIGATAIACLAAGQDQVSSKVRDPGYVVIDEVAGMLFSTLAISNFGFSILQNWKPWVFAFIAFRIFDILKPFPASFFDRKSKTAVSPYRRGFFIVFDDVVAGLYASLVFLFFSRNSIF